MQITVKNKHHIRGASTPGEYIGRGNVLGNPFSHMPGTKAQFIVADRAAAVAAYEIWLRKKIEASDVAICKELNRLFYLAQESPLDLVCFCAPHACHGDVVKKVLEEAYARVQRHEPKKLVAVHPLPKGSIFVFGSNTLGIHGKGAALTARREYGALPSVGEGLVGQSYALPTQWTLTRFMTLDEIQPRVETFICGARQCPKLTFQVTQVGCGLAGHKKEDIAPLFIGAPFNCMFDTAWFPILGPDHKYWGHV
jgi:hypothetical protein